MYTKKKYKLAPGHPKSDTGYVKLLNDDGYNDIGECSVANPVFLYNTYKDFVLPIQHAGTAVVYITFIYNNKTYTWTWRNGNYIRIPESEIDFNDIDINTKLDIPAMKLYKIFVLKKNYFN